jgi:hypothetical protein
VEIPACGRQARSAQNKKTPSARTTSIDVVIRYGQLALGCLSKQFRNVPFLTPLEMSPFGVSALFLSVLLIFLQEFRVGFWSIYSIPVYVVWLGPERNPA